MSRPQATLYTKDQTEMLFRNWQCTEPLPGKGKKVVIGFAGHFIDLAEVEWTDLKSDTGQRLWRITMSSQYGRDIERTICEGHVRLYKEHLMEMRRRANLERQQYIAKMIEHHGSNEFVLAEAIAKDLRISSHKAMHMVLSRART